VQPTVRNGHDTGECRCWFRRSHLWQWKNLPFPSPSALCAPPRGKHTETHSNNAVGWLFASRLVERDQVSVTGGSACPRCPVTTRLERQGPVRLHSLQFTRNAHTRGGPGSWRFRWALNTCDVTNCDIPPPPSQNATRFGLHRRVSAEGMCTRPECVRCGNVRVCSSCRDSHNFPSVGTMPPDDGAARLHRLFDVASHGTLLHSARAMFG